MTNLNRQINSIKDTIASHTARLDQIQTKLDTNRHHLSEEDVWEVQANIDRLRFNVEMERIGIKIINASIK